MKKLTTRTYSSRRISDLLRHRIYPYTMWENVYTVLQMERRLKELREIPLHYGFSHMEESDNQTHVGDMLITFLPWPRYYRRSWRIRTVQTRQRIGRFIQNIGNRISQ